MEVANNTFHQPTALYLSYPPPGMARVEWKGMEPTVYVHFPICQRFSPFFPPWSFSVDVDFWRKISTPPPGTTREVWRGMRTLNLHSFPAIYNIFHSLGAIRGCGELTPPGITRMMGRLWSPHFTFIAHHLHVFSPTPPRAPPGWDGGLWRHTNRISMEPLLNFLKSAPPPGFNPGMRGFEALGPPRAPPGRCGGS